MYTKISEEKIEIESPKFMKDFNQKLKKIEFTKIFVFLMLILSFTFIFITIISLFMKLSFESMNWLIHRKDTFYSLALTIGSLFFSLIILSLVGIPTAYLLAKRKTKIYKILDLLISIPIVLPPSVAGIALLTAFGNNGFISKFINPRVAFNFTALIFVQIFVALPIFVQLTKEGFENISTEVEEAARVSGAGEKEVLFYIFIPICFKNILMAIFMSFLRGAGEFGASMVFAGNLAGKTQTVSTYLYTLSQTNLSAGVSMAVIHILIFVIPILFIKIKLDKDK